MASGAPIDTEAEFEGALSGLGRVLGPINMSTDVFSAALNTAFPVNLGAPRGNSSLNEAWGGVGEAVVQKGAAAAVDFADLTQAFAALVLAFDEVR